MARKPKSEEARPPVMRRRQAIRRIGAVAGGVALAGVAGTIGSLAIKAARRVKERQITARTARFKRLKTKIADPEKLARFSVEKGLTPVGALEVNRITIALRKVDSTMTREHVARTIGENFSYMQSFGVRSCDGMIKQLDAKIRRSKAENNPAKEIARLERVRLVFEELKKFEKDWPKEFPKLRDVLLSAYKRGP